MVAKAISIEWAAAEFAKRGYAWFTNDTQPFNLNIFGVRALGRTANAFDDFLCMAWRFRGEWSLKVWPGTTDPGIHWLRNLLNPKGCAILVPGQYRGAYRLDLHGGRYRALCQRLGAVKVYRDRDRDEVLNMDPETVDVGYFGINIHRSNPSGWTDWVNRHSAGCQCFANAEHFHEAMALADKASGYYGNRFTYTLLEEV